MNTFRQVHYEEIKMSTYTDLRNRVKENITVGYAANDRTTIQKVKFHNEENEYWGTFTGKMSVDNVTINSGILNDVSVYNSYIKNATLVNADGIKINLSELGEQIDEISNDTIPGIRSDIATISSVIISSQDVPAALSGLDKRITDLSIAEDGKISSETEARISADADISSYFDSRINQEISDRISADFDISSYLDSKIDQEISDRISVDTILSAELHEYVDEHKHYHIKTVDSEVKMPFKATEFAVNVINGYDLPDAFVTDSERGNLVGKIERYVISSRNCEFVPYTDADATYLNILGTGAYIFENGRTSCDCTDPKYRLIYNRNGETGAVIDQTFTLSPAESGIRYVKHNGQTVGIVTGATEETVVSGYVKITADSSSPLSVFADGIEHKFTSYVPVEFNGGNDCLTFDSINCTFRCEMGISSYSYEGLSSGNTEWGKIFRTSVEGNLSSPSAFAVTFNPTESGITTEQSYRLSEENGFKTDVLRTNEKLDVIKYADNKVSYYNEKINYGYKLNITSETSTYEGEFVIGPYNRKLEDDFSNISVILSSTFPTWEIWKDPIVLAKNESGSYSCISTIQGSDISADFIGRQKLSVHVKSGDIGSDMVGTVTGSAYVKIDDSLAPYWQSQEFTFPCTYGSSVKKPALSTIAYVTERKEETLSTYSLNCQTEYSYNENSYNVNDIVIQIPNKEEGSSISREFLFVIKPFKTGVKANVRFVGEDGKDIKWFSNKEQKLEILTDTFITFRLQEVRDNKFMVIDWNLNKQEQEIDDLYGKLGKLSADTNAKLAIHDEQISGISSEVSALIHRDHKDISMMGELTANGQTSLSSFLITQDIFGGLGTTKVYPNWMYRMNGQSANPMVDNDGISNYIGDNDYVMFKNEKTIKEIVFSDINFIRDSKTETEKIAGDLSAWTNNNFVHLSGGNTITGYNKFIGKVRADYIEAPTAFVTELTSTNANATVITAETINAKNLSISSRISAELADITVRHIGATTANITTLSVPVSANIEYFYAPSAGINSANLTSVSADSINASHITADASAIYLAELACTLGTKISVDELSVSTNTTNITTNTTNIATNTSNINGLSGRYNNTFLSNEFATLNADNLVLFDEKTYEDEDYHRKYRMVLSAGTIVLKRINA